MTSTSTLATLITFSIDKEYAFVLVFSPYLIVLVGFVVFVILLIRWWLGHPLGRDYSIDATEIGTGAGKIVLKPNIADQQIAYKIWVELSTRKIGLEIDLDHDVISEVYDSWHSFFSVTRELIKDIPVNKVKHKSTQKIVRLSIDVLNKGLRPHLTTWQARFRQWYERELGNKGDVDPQALQQKYPHFDDLKKDMLIVNQRLIKYRHAMNEIVHGKGSDDGLE